MIQMGKSMPCLYEQMVAVPAMAIIQMLVVDYINYRERMTSSAEVPESTSRR